MVKIIDYQATEPIRKVNNNNPITIPHSPRNIVLVQSVSQYLERIQIEIM